MDWLFTPETYPCPLHPDTDLTPEVRSEVLARRAPTLANRALREENPRRRRFAVTVTCPGGTAADVEAKPHAQRIQGVVSR